MATIHVCDLCGKILPWGSDRKQYRIKEFWSLGPDSGWAELEVHDSCVKKLLEAVKREDIHA